MSIRLAIVGATGLVGRMMRQIVQERNLPFETVKFLASSRSAGTTLTFQGAEYTVEPLSETAFDDVDVVLSSTPGSVSKQYSPIAAKSGAVVVDNSSAWRMDPNVPLVVPEVNADQIPRHQGIIANPNCSTIQMVVALKPLHDLGRIKRIVVSTYQASSGKGASGLTELEAQVRAAGAGEPLPPVTAHKHQLFDDCVCDDWPMDADSGCSEEELKMVNETKKILGDDSIGVCVTCVRVPVRTGHSESINIEFENPVSVEQARDALSNAPGVVVKDDPMNGVVPLVQDAVGRDETFVGRIRKDPTVANGLNLWVVADNLRKGAATNAVQIAEHLVRQPVRA